MGNAPNASYSITVRVEFSNDAGMLGRLTSEIGQHGGDIGAVDLVSVNENRMTRDLTINCRDDAHAQEVINAVNALDNFTLLRSVL